MSLKSVSFALVTVGSAIAVAAGTAATTTTTTTVTTKGAAATTPSATTAAATTTTATALKPADATAIPFEKVTVADAGKTQTVKGKIVGTHCEKDICFLNFHTDYRKYVSVVVKAADFEKFAKVEGADIKAKMDWYTKQPGVQVTGTVTKYEGKSGARPQIMVTSADMIRPTTAN